MADTYDESYSSSTYEQSDMGGGGEQIASAIYLNEQLEQVTTVVLTKQGAIALQPSTPPDNPAVGDQWIDNSIFPNVIYTWDGTQWLRATVMSAEEVGAYTVAQVDEVVGLVQKATGDVADRVQVTEEALADGTGLATTITNTQYYKDDRDGAVTAGIDGLVDNLGKETWVNDNLPKMITESSLVKKADEILAKFKNGGGVNVLKNSTGFAGLLNWQVLSGAASQYIGSDCVDSGSGFSINTGVIAQAVTATAGKSYTVTLRVKKGTAGSAYVKISDGTIFRELDFIDTAAYNYNEVQIANFIPTTNSIIIELGATGSTTIFTAIMLNVGEIGLQWSSANGEMYNSSVTFDLNGVRVNSSVYDGYTVMSPQEFSGYYRNNQGVMQKVFTLNKDVTEVAKLNITATDASLEMGTLKIVYINADSKRGWAFIPSS